MRNTVAMEIMTLIPITWEVSHIILKQIPLENWKMTSVRLKSLRKSVLIKAARFENQLVNKDFSG